jgi:WD40 repeat protein
MKDQITYELLRLKYVKCLLAGDNVTALFLLRNELSKFSQFFLDEKKELSQLFLCKSKKELIKESGLDVNNKFFLEEFLKELEQRNGNEEVGGTSPFENWIKRYLAYEIMACKYHKSNSHSLLHFEDNICDENGLTKTVNNKTKKISKKETDCLVKRERKRKRMKHHCQTTSFNLETKQELTNIKEEVWKIKFSPDSKYIVAATKSNSIFCWKQK